MTIEEARALIPPGWVECDYGTWNRTTSLAWAMQDEEWDIYAIPAPKPEPRRVPMGEMVIVFDSYGTGAFTDYIPQQIRVPAGGLEAVANTKWKADPDAREWVEVPS